MGFCGMYICSPEIRKRSEFFEFITLVIAERAGPGVEGDAISTMKG